MSLIADEADPVSADDGSTATSPAPWAGLVLSLLALLIVGASAVRLGVGRLPRAGRPWGGLPGIARPRLTIRSRLNPLLRAAGRLRLVERLRAP